MVRAGAALWFVAKGCLNGAMAVRTRVRKEYRDSTLPRLEGNPGLVRRLAAARILFFPRAIWRLWRLDFFRPYFGRHETSDIFFFLTHNYYLSKYFTLRERVACAISHYQHERRHCGLLYHKAVYHSSDGILLWHRVVDGTPYSIVLRATEDLRFEGDLSILCMVGGNRIARMSFTYVEGKLFGLATNTTMFVTRNQTDRGPDLQRFRQDFKQNSPPYFCLAALCGIAMAHGFHFVYMVKENAQIAYDDRYRESFTNSYSVFWETFGGEEISGTYAYKMRVPLDVTPILKVKNRSRAIARRQNWLAIMVEARQVILEQRLSRSPPPVDIEISKFLPLTVPAEATRPPTSGPFRRGNAKSAIM